MGSMIVPGIGTAIGAVVGTIGGLLAGIFSKKKDKVTDDLMKVFPGLVDEAGASADAGEPCRVHAECGVCCRLSGLPGPIRGELPRRSALNVERSAPSP